MLLFFILCNPLFIAAQAPAFSFRNISTNEGLSQCSVVDIAVDKTGFLWFATQEGLNRYNGKDFLVFKKNFDDVTTRSGNRLGKIIPGNDNDLWLITSGGKLERMSLYNNTFKSWDTVTGDSIPLPPVSCLYVDKNDQLWMGTENEGLIVFNPGSNSISRYTTQTNQPARYNYLTALFQIAQLLDHSKQQTVQG